MPISFKKAERMARDGIITVEELQKLRSDGAKDGVMDYADKARLNKVRKDHGDKFTPAAKEFDARMRGIDEDFLGGNLQGKIAGLGATDAAKLEKAGVFTVGQLFLKGGKAEDRQTLAQTTGISLKKLESLVEKADLARVEGIGLTFARVLHEVGINNISELGDQDPAALRRQILDFLHTDKGKKITTTRPSEARVQKWVESARVLPKLLHYEGQPVGDAKDRLIDLLPDDIQATRTPSEWRRMKPSTIFGYLPQYVQSSILWNPSRYFTGDSVESSPATRYPTAVRNTLAGIEANPNDHIHGPDGGEVDVSGLHLESVERVKMNDDTLGFVVTYEFVGEGYLDYEGSSSGPVELEGNFMMTVNNDGKVLDSECDAWI